MTKDRFRIALSILALVLVLAAGIGRAQAYFTTYCSAIGSYPVSMGDQTRIRERFSNWTKHVFIRATEDSKPVYIRARAIAGLEWMDEMEYDYDEADWQYNEEDGWFYYQHVLNGGEEAEELTIHIDHVSENITDPDTFSVVVVYESTQVLYAADGTPYCDWSRSWVSTADAEGGN